MTYEKLKTACSLIREGVPFIAPHPDFHCPTPEGPLPACGAMIALIPASPGVKPKIIGQPYPEMNEALRSKYELADFFFKDMVCYLIYTDMAMAKAAGIVGILVLNGETQLKDL